MAKNLGKVLQGIKTGVKKHSPELLMSFGIAGMITTTVLAVRATPSAAVSRGRLECSNFKT